LLVHQQSRIEKVEDLAGKNILLSSGSDIALGRLWLETLLMEKGIGSLESFFRKTSLTTKDSQTVLPVFFHKADACLVARSSFETIAELNPQLRNELKILAQSPGFAASLVCIRKGYDPILREDLIDVLRNLHTEPKGQQILTLFKTDKLVPCENAHLAKIGQLISKHNQLQKASRPTEIRAEGSR
jgi:phosphonate transport system substrate-binding protein